MYLYSKVLLTKPTYERFKTRDTLGKVSCIVAASAQIITHENDYFTVTNMNGQAGPNIFCVKNFDAQALDLKSGMQVVVVKQQLQLAESLLIDYHQAQTEELANLIFAGTRRALLSKIHRIQRADWYVKKKFEKQELARSQSERMLIDDSTLMLQESLATHNQQALRESLQQFVGLGIDATPSGDDFLLGMAYVAALNNYPNRVLRATLQILIPVMQAQTNRLSAQLFAFALQGEVRGEITQAVQAILADAAYVDVEDQIRGILALDMNSGFDVLTGIIVAFQIAFW